MKNNPTDCYTLHIASSAFQIPDKPSPEERLLALLDVLSGSATFKPWLQNAPSSLVRSPCWPCWGWGTGQETSCIPLRPSVPAVLCQCFLHLILTSVWMGVPQKATEVFMQSDTHFAHIWKAAGFPWCPVVGQIHKQHTQVARLSCILISWWAWLLSKRSPWQFQWQTAARPAALQH